MTIGEGAGVPAGWYPDPVDSARLRRWDGHDWTEDVAAAESAAPAVPLPEPTPEPQRLQSVPQAPPLPPRPPSAPVAEPEPEPGPEAQPEPLRTGGFDDLPEWATLPGLTLPPDLSAIPGLSPRSPLATPHFEDAEADQPRQAPQFGSPLPTLPPPGSEAEAESEQESEAEPEPTPTAASAPSASSPSAEPALSRRELRDLRDREAAGARAPSADDRSAAPYAPPPKGGQFSAPPPPGIAYTPPPPGEAQPASALAPPPAARRDASGAAALGIPQFASVPAPAQARQQGAAASQAGTPVARARPAGFGVPQSRGTSTVGVWVIAVIPAIHFAVVYLVFSVLAQPFVPGLQWGVLAAPVIFALVFAAVDRRQLIGNGHDDAPSALFAIIPPLYLIVRVVKLGRSSLAPLIVWIILQAAAAAAVVVVMPAVLKAAIGAS
jgi:hypothetical protein